MPNFLTSFLVQDNNTSWCCCLLIIFPIFLVVIFYKWCFNSAPFTKSCLPSPPKFPIIGNLHQLGLYPHRTLHSMAQKYGPLMLLHFGKKPVLVVSSAKVAREVLKTHDLTFSNRPNLKLFEIMSYGGKAVTLAPYGEYWRQVRSISVLHLLSNKKVKSFHRVRVEETAIMIEKIRKKACCSSLVNLREIFSSIANDVICRVALGRIYSDEGNCGRKFMELQQLIHELLGGFVVGDYIPWLDWVGYVSGLYGKTHKVNQEMDRFLEEVVEGHVNRSKETDDDDDDFVDVLLSLQRSNAIGFPIDKTTIKAVILDMLGAGTHTTHIVLEWTMAELLRHQHVMKKLQEEVRNNMKGEKSHIITEEVIAHNNFPYLKAVLTETLRLHPPLPLLVPRENMQDINLFGHHIGAKTRLIVNAWAISRDPNCWENPLEFKPERFLNSSTVDYNMVHNFQSIPFGVGRRGCPGIQFAMVLIETVIANIAFHFDWSLPNGEKGENLDMFESNGLGAQKKIPLLADALSWNKCQTYQDQNL